MNNWILVKHNIKKIININRENYRIEYDEENAQRKILEIKKVKNKYEQLKNKNIQEHNQEDVIIDEQEMLLDKDEGNDNNRKLSNL